MRKPEWQRDMAALTKKMNHWLVRFYAGEICTGCIQNFLGQCDYEYAMIAPFIPGNTLAEKLESVAKIRTDNRSIEDLIKEGKARKRAKCH